MFQRKAIVVAVSAMAAACAHPSVVALTMLMNEHGHSALHFQRRNGRSRDHHRREGQCVDTYKHFRYRVNEGPD